VTSAGRADGLIDQYWAPARSAGRCVNRSNIHAPIAWRNSRSTVAVYGTYLTADVEPLVVSKKRTGSVVRTLGRPRRTCSIHGSRSS
jgi:hypothetical protein